MKTTTKSALIMTAVSSMLVIGAAQASDSARHDAESISKAKVSITEAIRTAEKEGNGQAISAEYEFKRGNPAYYEVKVLSSDGQKLTKYELSPVTGKVKDATDEKVEKFFTRLQPNAISAAPTSLTRAITTAETRAGGKAVGAEIDRDGDQVQYTIKVVKLDGDSEKVKVNGSDGKVASAK
jgi:uncharacterized membrane protein YkoI